MMYCTLYRMVSCTSLVALRVRGGYIYNTSIVHVV